MHSPTVTTEPMFELKGLAGRIDLSAWLSGTAFAEGMLFAASPGMAADILSGGMGFRIVAGSFGIFLATVLLIQRHMRLSPLANTFGSPRRLVTSGPFRVSRNPIYVAFFVPLTSIAYFSSEAAVAAMALYVLTMNLTVIRREERDLLRAFGAEYAAYLEKVPRWAI